MKNKFNEKHFHFFIYKNIALLSNCNVLSQRKVYRGSSLSKAHHSIRLALSTCSRKFSEHQNRLSYKIYNEVNFSDSMKPHKLFGRVHTSFYIKRQISFSGQRFVFLKQKKLILYFSFITYVYPLFLFTAEFYSVEYITHSI